MDITDRPELWEAHSRIARTAIRTDTPEGSEIHGRIYSLINPAQALLNRWYAEHIDAPAAAALAENWVDD